MTQWRHRHTALRGGFTLLELIVALAVASVVLAVAPFAVERMLDGAQYRSTVRDMMSTMRAARNDALMSGHEAVFRIDVDQRRYGVGESLSKTIPAALMVEFVVAEHEIDSTGVGGIRFYPDGSSTGGSVLIRRGDGAAAQLRVGWLLGRLSLHAL